MPAIGNDDQVAAAQRVIEATRQAAEREAFRDANRPPIYPRDGQLIRDQHRSIGEAFIESDAYRGWVERFPTGGPSGPGEYRSDPVEIRLSMRDASRQLKACSLFTMADASGGALSDPALSGCSQAGSCDRRSCVIC
jgi:hypothetical protein